MFIFLTLIFCDFSILKSRLYTLIYSSELEEVYEQFSRWLDDPILEDDETKRELDSRDLAVIRFAGALLKRTLSESFAGVPLTDGCVTTASEETTNEEYVKKNKLILSTRSLSLELARQKHKLAAQLVSFCFNNV